MSISGDVYLPDLGKCLAGESLVLSWNDAFSSLLRHEDGRRSGPFSSFLASDSSKALLAQPLPRFPPPSPKSKSALETRTAAINVSPSASNISALQELKEDALWLSGQTNTDEVESLRIVVLEWQRRPQAELHEGFSETELASLTDALGQGYDSQTPYLRSQNASASDLDSGDQKRAKLLRTFLKERTGLLGASGQLMQAVLVQLGLAPAGFTRRSPDQNAPENVTPGPLEDVFPHLRPTLKRCDQVNKYIEAVQHILDDDHSSMNWGGDETLRTHLSHDLLSSKAREILILMDIILLHVRSSISLLKPDIILSWFKCMGTCNFFTDLTIEPSDDLPLFRSLQASAAIVTLAILDPATSIGLALKGLDKETLQSPATDTSYFLDYSVASEIHAVLCQAAFASITHVLPAIFAWGLVLYAVRDVGQGLRTEREARVQRAIDQGTSPESQTGRRSSTGSIGSIQQTVYEEILDQLSHQFDNPPIEFMVETSIARDRVFDVMSALATCSSSDDSLVFAYKLGALQDLVKMALPVVRYSAEILTSQIAILAPITAGTDSIHVTRQSTVASTTVFFNDDFLIHELFETSAARFPFEAIPFLQLCRAMLSADAFLENGSHFVIHRLQNMMSFTNEVTATSIAFHTIREEENANLVCLEQDLCMTNQTSQRLISNYCGESVPATWIPAGVIGEAITENPPPVIRWFHSYSGLVLLGAWLDLHRAGHLSNAFTSTEPVNFIVSEVIKLMGGLLSRSMSAKPSQPYGLETHQDSLSLLEEISSGIAHDDDIITVIFDIFESELQALRHHLDRDGACEVLVACVEFIVLTVKILPDRVWRSLFRSSLIGMRENDGTLLLIIASAATHSGASAFFEACSLMYDYLVDDCLSHVMSDLRTESFDRMRKETSSHTYSSGNIATDLMSTQLSSLTRAMMETLESTSGSVWQNPAQQYRTSRNLFATFEKILSYTYGADDATDLHNKLTAVLAPSSIHITRLYRGEANNSASIIPPLQYVVRSIREAETYPDDPASRALEECVISSLSLCSSLVRLGKISGTKSSLEKQLLDTTPAFIRVLTTSPAVTIKSLALMEVLLAACVDSQTASLLGYLGLSSSRNFLELLRTYAIADANAEVKVSAWRLARQLVRRNQHWSAIMLLTGSCPNGVSTSNEVTNRSADKNLRGTPLLVIAMDTLSDLGLLEEHQAVSILQFTATAQENWIWAQNTLQSHSEFLPSTIAYVSHLSFRGDSLLQSYQTEIASLVTQIVTIHLHYVRTVRDFSTVKRVFPLLTWLSRNAIEVESYNASLHANLRKNFASKFAPFALNHFKRTAFSDVSFGRLYFYDVGLATKMLFTIQQQNQRNGASAGQSFSEELTRANVNLSLVQSQLYLLQSFKALCVEHALSFIQDREVQKLMGHVVQSCIQANTRDCPPEKIFNTLFLTRADFALALIQPLVETKAKGSDFITLLGSAWECLRFGNTTFESAILSESLAYYRTNLSILLFAMQFHIQKSQRARSGASEAKPSDPTSIHSNDSVMLEIASLGLVEGLQTAVRSLGDQHQRSEAQSAPSDDDSVNSKDIQLLLNVLQSLLRMPTIPHLTSQLSQYLTSSSMLQSCLRLYSWSHILTSPDLGNVPIYAELSLQFLASLSSLPVMAEEVAIEGVLTIISTSRITQSIRTKPGGVSQFDKQPHFQTLYRAWASGILPICLNLLHSVGRAMAGEVAAFLNQFPNN